MTRLLAVVVAASALLLPTGWAAAQWTAYNDVIYDSASGHPALQPNVTTYNIGNGSPGPASGVLKDKATGASTGVTAAFTQSGGVVWQPAPTSGGSDCSTGTDARSVFDPATTASLMGTVYYGSSGWYVDLTFTGLNPTKAYTFAATANRNDGTYTDRLTRYTISGADVFTNASSAGTTISGGGASTTFCTGYNTLNGNVARWTGISPGTDGSFTVRAEAGSSQYKAYAFDAFQLEEIALTAIRVSTLDATDVQPNGATLNGQLTDLGTEPQAEVYFRWGTSSGDLNQATTPQVLTAPGAFSAPLTGLTPETLYYFKAVATAPPETAEGTIRSFLYADNYGLQFNGLSSHVTMGPAPGLGSATFTVETWFKRTGTGQAANSGSGGVDAVPLVCKGVSEGDGSSIDANYFFGIRAGDNVLTADFEDMASGLNHPVAGTTAIQNNTWYHAAATYDGTTWRLYLNGVLDAESTVNATPRYDSIQHFGLGTAINSTGAQSGRFDGVLDEVRVWNYARGLAEIRTAMNSEMGPAPGLIGRWGINEGSGTAVADSSGYGNHGTIAGATWALGSPFDANVPPDLPVLVAPADGSQTIDTTLQLTVHVADWESDNLVVSFHGRQLAKNPPQPFRIIALPDTQNYSKTYPQTFIAQTQWIVDHRQSMNIVYVGHEGDIVNDCDQSVQWDNAEAAIAILDTLPDLPYGLCVGNHDENPRGDPNGTGVFNARFPFSDYLPSRPWYGGHYGTDNDNHYILFSAGGMDFIAIHLEYDDARPQPVYDWVGGLLQTHSSRRAIVVAHNILDIGTPTPWTAPGLALYNALKGYPNLFLMLCGHNHGEGMRTEVYQDNTVYVLLADYQSRNAGGDGFLRIIEFIPTDNRINVSTYSPTLDQYERDGDSEFSLDYGMGGASYVELATFTAVQSGADVAFEWANLAPEHRYDWYVTVSDGNSVTTGPAWSFIINRPPGPEIGVAPTSLERPVHALNSLTDDSFTVANVGIGTLNYTISDDAAWLSVVPVEGDSTGEADPIRIVYNVADLSVGTHTAHIAVASDDAWNSEQTVTVTVHVETVRPDLDQDGDVDQADFGRLQACLAIASPPQPPPECVNADLDDDNLVDGSDIAILRGCIAGAKTPTDPQCDD